MHTVGLPEIIGKLSLIPAQIGFDSLWLIKSSPLEEPIEALDGGAKAGWQKLPFPGHPEDHWKGSSLEFRL